MVDRVVLWGCAVIGLASVAVPTGRPHLPHVVIVKERWAPLAQWTCTAQEEAEHEYACAHRERSARIGGKS